MLDARKLICRTAMGAIVIMCCTALSQSQTASRPSPRELIAIDPPAAQGAAAAKLSSVGESVFLTWIEPAASDSSGNPAHPGGGSHKLCFSTMSDRRWSDPITIAQRSDFVINWADMPSMTRAGDGTLYASWLQKQRQGEGYSAEAYDAIIARSSDGGKTWTTLGKVNDDTTAAEHGFVSLVPEGDGVRAFWLDGRAMASSQTSQTTQPHAHGGAMGTMELRTALISSSIGPSEVLDARVCECCNTAAAVTPSGPVIVYRDRSDHDDRDIFMVKRDASGPWTQPTAVYPDGWQISACPVNGPAIDVRGKRLLVGWYTASEHQPRVQAAFSENGGVTFSKPLTLDTNDVIGRAAVVQDRNGTGVVCWMAGSGRLGSIKLARMVNDGLIGDPVEVTRFPQTSNSTFPSIARVGNKLLVVWTDVSQPTKLRAVLTQF